MARIVSLIVLLVLIVILGITFFQVIAPYLLPLFIAVVATILSQPMMRYFQSKWPKHPRVAAGLTTATVLSVVMVPLMLTTIVAALQLFAFAQDVSSNDSWSRVVNRVKDEAVVQTESFFSRLVALTNTMLPKDRQQSPEEVQAQVQQLTRQAITAIGNRSLGIASTAAGTTIGMATIAFTTVVAMATGLFIFSVALYYFLADGPALLAASERMIPLHVEYQRQMLTQFSSAVRAVVSATFLAALAQGVALAIGLWFFGFSHLMVLLVAATLAALIPFVGTSLVWIPCVLVLIGEGHWGQAVSLAIWGSVLVGTLDNVVRTYALNNDTELHPLLALVCVLGGLEVMGLWGVFVGPIVASCLHALVGIFNRELFQLCGERTPVAEAAATGAAVAGAIIAAAGGTTDTPPPSPPNVAPAEPVG